jgi:hypothetical protein
MICIDTSGGFGNITDCIFNRMLHMQLPIQAVDLGMCATSLSRTKRVYIKHVGILPCSVFIHAGRSSGSLLFAHTIHDTSFRVDEYVSRLCLMLAAFRATPSNVFLKSGETKYFNVTFSPLQDGVHEDVLTVCCATDEHYLVRPHVDIRL